MTPTNIRIAAHCGIIVTNLANKQINKYNLKQSANAATLYLPEEAALLIRLSTLPHSACGVWVPIGQLETKFLFIGALWVLRKKPRSLPSSLQPEKESITSLSASSRTNSLMSMASVPLLNQKQVNFYNFKAIGLENYKSVGKQTSTENGKLINRRKEVG